MKEYQNKFQNKFYSVAIPKLNKLVGIVASGQFSLGLFLKIGVSFSFEQKDELPIKYYKNKKKEDEVCEEEKKLVSFITYTQPYVKFEDNFNQNYVNFKIIYKDKKHLNELLSLMDEEIIIKDLLISYLHEIQHLLRRHNTTIFGDILLKITKKLKIKNMEGKIISEYKDIHENANIAEDYSINQDIYNLLKKTKKVDYDINLIFDYMLIDEKKYNGKNELMIFEEIMKNKPEIIKINEDEHSITLSIQEKNKKGKNIGSPKIITIPKQKNRKDIKNNAKNDRSIDSIAQSIENQINTTKGNGTVDLNKFLGKSIETNVDWFDTLSSNFYTIVSNVSRNTTVSWSNFNKKYMHSHMSPTHKYIENKLNIILSVDNSGSMSDEALRKVIYIIEEKGCNIEKLTILKHTDFITKVLIKEENTNIIFDELSKRDTGGTSHKDVFKYIETEIDYIDIKKSIFISFSDNYSDIEKEYFNYKNIQNIKKVWLNVDGKPVKDEIPGLKIDIH